MKKKIFILIIFLVLLLVFLNLIKNQDSDLNINNAAITTPSENIYSFLSEEQNSLNGKLENIEMHIDENSITPIGGMLILKDKNKDKNWFNNLYRIEVNHDGEWVPLEFTNAENYVFEDVEITSNNSDNTIIFELNWEDFYGCLDSGKYRIVKEVFNQDVYAYFEIE